MSRLREPTKSHYAIAISGGLVLGGLISFLSIAHEAAWPYFGYKLIGLLVTTALCVALSLAVLRMVFK